MGNWCEKYPEIVPYLNLCAYSPLELALIFAGTIFWVLAYGIIIRDSFKTKFVEMPAGAAAANIAWEFVWGFLFTTDLGLVFVWGLRIWFFFDLLIVYNLFRYGSKQTDTPIFVKYFKPVFGAGILAWAVLFYFFIKNGYDTPMGATSAYMITPPMSFWYILLFSWINQSKLFSYPVAWYKMLGSAFMLVYVFLHYPALGFLLALAVISLLLDIWYIFIFYQKRLEKS
jgi:hypothetical protein